MALTTAEDAQVLQGWSWLTFYQRNRSTLVAIAKGVYERYSGLASQSAPVPIVPAHIEQHLIAVLQQRPIFQRACASGARAYVQQDIHPLFAQALVRYILDQDWTFIIHS